MWKLGPLLEPGLKRIDSISALEVVEVDVIVSIASSEELNTNVDKRNKWQFRTDVSKNFSLSPKYLNTEQKNMKIYCHLGKSDETMVSLIRCLALTRVQAEHRKNIWKVQSFKNLLTNCETSFVLKSTGTQLPQIVLTGVLSKRSKLFHISVSVPDLLCNEKILIAGKISLLANDGSLKLSIKDSFTFLKSTSQNRLKFSLGISQAASYEYLENSDLLLLCDFSISNGEMHNEIIESCYLPNERRIVADSQYSAEKETISAVQTEDTSESIKDLKSSHKLEQPLLDDYTNYEYLNEEYCDAILTAGNKIFPVHKCILCLRSPVFKTMFETDLRESTNKKVNIEDLGSVTMRHFLLFLYTEKLENLEWEMATKLFYAAVKYQVISLKVKCQYFLKSHLSLQNVCKVLDLAELHRDEGLISACRDFVLNQDALEIFSSEEWKEFTVRNPVLSSEILQKYFLMKNSVSSNLPECKKY